MKFNIKPFLTRYYFDRKAYGWQEIWEWVKQRPTLLRTQPSIHGLNAPPGKLSGCAKLKPSYYTLGQLKEVTMESSTIEHRPQMYQKCYVDNSTSPDYQLAWGYIFYLGWTYPLMYTDKATCIFYCIKFYLVVKTWFHPTETNSGGEATEELKGTLMKMHRVIFMCDNIIQKCIFKHIIKKWMLITIKRMKLLDLAVRRNETRTWGGPFPLPFINA